MQIAEYIVYDTEEGWCPWNVLGATHKGKTSSAEYATEDVNEG
jgi:hypothetical protein